MIKLTNCVFRCQLFPLNFYCLEDIAEKLTKQQLFSKIKLYTHKPKMLVLKLASQASTIILFPSGKMRLMGSAVKNKGEAKQLIKTMFSDNVGKIRLQTMTATFDFKECIHLGKLKLFIDERYHYGKNCMPLWQNFYESELFPALQLKLWGAIHCNVFASGKCVITGIKHLDEACVIIDDLTNFIKEYKHC
jgi:TATA-box binding protein (TBP) (component of TFIID and TFIIIB)